MSSKTVKESIINTYGTLAKSRKNDLISKLFGCCDLGETADTIASNIGYSNSEIRQAPENANLGVGCGNPSALIHIKEGDHVLDLGSGAGFDAFVVSKKVGPTGSVTGIDLSDDMLSLARKNAKKGGYENINFLKGDIEDIPVNDELIDHVISNCVINLSLNKSAVYKEAYRVLKKGGQLAISDIVLDKELPDFVKNSLAGHIACVSGAEKLDTYMQYVHDAGFTDVVIQTKSAFPLELMLTDPQLKKIAKEMDFDLNSEEAKDIASRVSSISFTARK